MKTLRRASCGLLTEIKSPLRAHTGFRSILGCLIFSRGTFTSLHLQKAEDLELVKMSDDAAIVVADASLAAVARTNILDDDITNQGKRVRIDAIGLSEGAYFIGHVKLRLEVYPSVYMCYYIPVIGSCCVLCVLMCDVQTPKSMLTL